MKVTFSGFDEFNKHLEELQKNAEKLGKTSSVTFSELFTSSFMTKYTDSFSINEFMQKGNFNTTSQEDFESIAEHELNSFVASHTKFSTWNEMRTKAFEEWSVRQLAI